MTEDWKQRAKLIRDTAASLDDIQPPDPFGHAAVGLCQRIHRVGYENP